mmetsp:Transcript_28039/g.80451  ORF Transcript_28039/g.80451 Transcript_28039/m.80451 type:complete len:596 (+) Transcript_28039:255-2042(+)
MSADGRVPAAIALQALGAQHLTEACLVRADGVLRLRRQDVHLALSEVEACVVVRIVLRQGCLRFCRQLALKLGGLVGVDHHNLHGPTAQDAPPLIWLDAEACLVHQGLAGLLELLQRTERGGQVILGEDLVVAEEAVVDGVHAGPEERREDHVHLVLDPLALERLVGRAGRTEVVAHADGHGRVDPHGDPLRSALQHGDDPAVLHVSGISQLMNLGALVLRGHWPELTPWDGASEAQSSRQVQTGAEAADAHGLGKGEGPERRRQGHLRATALISGGNASEGKRLHQAAADPRGQRRDAAAGSWLVGHFAAVRPEGRAHVVRGHLDEDGVAGAGLEAHGGADHSSHDEDLRPPGDRREEGLVTQLRVVPLDPLDVLEAAGHEVSGIAQAEGTQEGLRDVLDVGVGRPHPAERVPLGEGGVASGDHCAESRRHLIDVLRGDGLRRRRPAQQLLVGRAREHVDGRGPGAAGDGAHGVHVAHEAQGLQRSVGAQGPGQRPCSTPTDADCSLDFVVWPGELPVLLVHGRDRCMVFAVIDGLGSLTLSNITNSISRTTVLCAKAKLACALAVYALCGPARAIARQESTATSSVFITEIPR